MASGARLRPPQSRGSFCRFPPTGEGDTLLSRDGFRQPVDENLVVAHFLRRRPRRVSSGVDAAAAAAGAGAGAGAGEDDDAALLQRAALFEPVKLTSAWDAHQAAALSPRDPTTRPPPPHLPAPRPSPSCARLLLLFLGRALLQLWRGRWTFLFMARRGHTPSPYLASTPPRLATALLPCYSPLPCHVLLRALLPPPNRALPGARRGRRRRADGADAHAA